LVCSVGVLQPERHRSVAVGAKQGDEHGLLLVFFLDSDLMVPGVAIEEAEQVAARRGVDDLINLRQPKGVLGGSAC
jgi:acetyl-CoA carboxylase alpha subunit